MEFIVTTVINLICCDPTQCPAVCMRPTPIPNRPVKPVLTAQPANLCDPSILAPWGGTLLEKGSDTAIEVKGQLRRCI